MIHTGELDCGCKVVSSILSGNTIEFCPLHKSAPKLYEASKLYIEHQQGTRGHYCSVCHNEIEKALAEAELK